MFFYGRPLNAKMWYLKVEFFKDDGKNSLDSVSQNLYGVIEQIRKDVPTGDTGPLSVTRWPCPPFSRCRRSSRTGRESATGSPSITSGTGDSFSRMAMMTAPSMAAVSSRAASNPRAREMRFKAPGTVITWRTAARGYGG